MVVYREVDDERQRRGIPNLIFEALSSGYRLKRPWCRRAGALMQRVLIRGDNGYCKICGRTEPIKR